MINKVGGKGGRQKIDRTQPPPFGYEVVEVDKDGNHLAPSEK
ncbi:MAG: hypothetical protein V4714_04235 [Bacteroidota bacterium]